MFDDQSPDPSDLEPSPFNDDAGQSTVTIERDPVPASSAFNINNIVAESSRADENPIPYGLFLRGVDDPSKAVHPFDGKCKVCLKRQEDYLEECEREGIPPNDPPLVTVLDVQWRQIEGAEGWFAVNCCDRCYELAQRDEARERANRELWERICPVEFRSEWDATKGSQALYDRVMAWGAAWNKKEGTKPKKGLVIHGDSDTAKTRVCWQLYKRLALEGVGVLFIESIDLLDNMPNEAFTVECLIIDDLGNDVLDHKKEQRLLKLLRSRAQWHRPYVVTSQFTGADLVARFKQEATGEAVVRRLREFCDPIHARKPGDGSIRRDANGRAVMA